MSIEIDDIDRKILYELDRNARIPETKLAKIISRSKASVRYRIKRLEEKGIIAGYHAWIDPTKAGYQVYKIYLKVANKPERKKEFLEYLKEEKRVFWLGVADGAWDVGITFFAKSNADFYKFQQKFLAAFKDIILSKKTGVAAEVIITPRSFYVDKYEHQHISFFNEPESNKLDEIETKTLKLLFKNARISIVDIAREANTTVEKVRTRMKRLENDGFIVCYKAAVDHNKIGLEFFKTFLYLAQRSEEEEKKLITFALSHPNIIHMVKIVSPWELELEIMVENYMKYTEILNDLKEKFPDVIVDTDTAIMGGDFVFPCNDIVFD